MNKKITKIIFIVWLILSLCLIAIALLQMINNIQVYQHNYEVVKQLNEDYDGNLPSDSAFVVSLNKTLQSMILMIIIFSCSLLTFAIVMFIPIKEFIFKPLLDKLNERKQKHAQAKAERAEETKQAKIAELEQQLEELKKDE